MSTEQTPNTRHIGNGVYVPQPSIQLLAASVQDIYTDIEIYGVGLVGSNINTSSNSSSESSEVTTGTNPTAYVVDLIQEIPHKNCFQVQGPAMYGTMDPLTPSPDVHHLVTGVYSPHSSIPAAISIRRQDVASHINSLSASLLLNIFLSFEVGIAHAIANFK